MSQKRKNFKLDIAETNKIKKIIQKYNIKTIIHAAAFSYVLEGEKNKKYFNNNIKKTKLFINFCKKKKLKILFFYLLLMFIKSIKKLISLMKMTKKNQRIFMVRINLKLKLFKKKI